jgi:hypothetical protein
MKYEYSHKRFPDLDAAVDYAHFMQMRIVGFQHDPHHIGIWSVIFETEHTPETVANETARVFEISDGNGETRDCVGRRVLTIEEWKAKLSPPRDG